jgi:hypothetical protein
MFRAMAEKQLVACSDAITRIVHGYFGYPESSFPRARGITAGVPAHRRLSRCRHGRLSAGRIRRSFYIHLIYKH